MTQKEYNLLDAVLMEGLDNTRVTLACDVESMRCHFGTEEERTIMGRFLVIYASYQETMPSLDRLVADYEMILMDNSEYYLRIFLMDG